MHTRPRGVEPKCRVPWKVYANLDHRKSVILPFLSLSLTGIFRTPTSIGNFPPSHFNCAAYVTNRLIPLTCGSWTLMASVRKRSMIKRSSANISGRWSYFEEMYWVMAFDKETPWECRNGSWRILLLRDHWLAGRKRPIHLKSRIGEIYAAIVGVEQRASPEPDSRSGLSFGFVDRERKAKTPPGNR